MKLPWLIAARLTEPVYAVQIGQDIWVVHVFQKKSRTGIKTPKHEIDQIRERIRQLKEMLR